MLTGGVDPPEEERGDRRECLNVFQNDWMKCDVLSAKSTSFPQTLVTTKCLLVGTKSFTQSVLSEVLHHCGFSYFYINITCKSNFLQNVPHTGCKNV